MRFEGQVALVTGATSGIGWASANALAREGAKVGILSRDAKEVNDRVDELRKNGYEALPLVADISEVDAIQKAYERLMQEWGRLDVVFANAGINGVWAPLEELDPDEWDQTIKVNLRGTYLTIKYAVPHMKKDGGSVIITSSVNGTRMFSNTGATAYACTKAAQVAFAKMTTLELAKHKIRINVICPGAIESEIEDNTERQNVESEQEPVEFPEGKIPLTDGAPGKAEQVADLVLFLASDASSHITGTEMSIDGGQSLLQG